MYSVYVCVCVCVCVYVDAAIPALQCVLEKEILFLILHFIFRLTAPSRGKALSVDFFSLHCYLPLQIESNQKSGGTDRLLEMEYTFSSIYKGTHKLFKSI